MSAQAATSLPERPLRGPGHLLVLGSNLQPEQHLGAMLDGLLAIAPTLYLSRVAWTPPIGLDSAHRFLNAAVFLPTSLASAALKQACIAIEERLGRDRSHPDRKHRDRPADIDLIAAVTDIGHDAVALPEEIYLAPFARDVLAYVRGDAPPDLHWPATRIAYAGQFLGEAPATIHRDHGTGLVRVGEH